MGTSTTLAQQEEVFRESKQQFVGIQDLVSGRQSNPPLSGKIQFNSIQLNFIQSFIHSFISITTF